MGKLFVIDGTDGSGKQTQFEELKKHKLDIKNKRIIDKILTGKILHLDGDSCLDNKTFPLT